MGRKVGLTAEEVVGAAVAIADAEGLEAVTLASVAARLEVRSPSLYTHVAGLEGVRRAVGLAGAAAMAEALRTAAGERRGIEALGEIAHGYRRFARAHPGLYAAAQRAVRPEEDPEVYEALLAAIAPVLEALREAGVTEHAERIHLARALRSALHGFVTLERLGGFGLAEEVEESFRRLVELLLAAIRASAGER